MTLESNCFEEIVFTFETDPTKLIKQAGKGCMAATAPNCQVPDLFVNIHILMEE